MKWVTLQENGGFRRRKKRRKIEHCKTEETPTLRYPRWYREARPTPP